MTESSELELDPNHITNPDNVAINAPPTETTPLLISDPTNSTTNDSGTQKLHSRTQEPPQKNIGTVDSFVYILIQMYGYGVLALPVVYQQGSHKKYNQLCILYFFELKKFCFRSTQFFVMIYSWFDRNDVGTDFVHFLLWTGTTSGRRSHCTHSRK
jgi:hypothetical protein